MILKNFKNKLLMILLTAIIIMPTIVYAYSDKVYIGGENIGIKVNSEGVLVVGFYDVNKSSPGKNAGLKIGDVITKVDDTVIDGITDLSKKFKEKKTLKITYRRNNKEKEAILKLALDDGVYKTGLYVKDSIVGIGTLTFIDPFTNRFGALGHEILEQTTGVKFEIKEGKIFESKVTGIDRSTKSEIGEKNAIDKGSKNGIKKGDAVITNSGLIGRITSVNNFSSTVKLLTTDKINNNELIDISSDISLGDAYIETVIKGTLKEQFKINILKFDKESDTKNILFEVTDEKLLERGNGIVQGMSGSPIIQNNKLVGAVTHVVVGSPHRGFGILITNMLKESEK